MNLKVISGGQTGADVAGLWAAKLFGIPTGGWAPKSFATLSGNHPEMAETFSMKEHQRGYRGRTISNLKESNLTIVCSEKMSAGTKLTINQCRAEKIPCYVFLLDPSDLNNIDVNTYIKMRSFIKNSSMIHEHLVLNVAGNSTQNNVRAFEFTFRLCHKLFTELGYTSSVDVDQWNRYKDTWR